MTVIRELRKSKGIATIDFCYHVRLHPITISAVENRRLVLSPASRGRICEYLGKDMDELFDSNGLAI